TSAVFSCRRMGCATVTAPASFGPLIKLCRRTTCFERRLSLLTCTCRLRHYCSLPTLATAINSLTASPEEPSDATASTHGIMRMTAVAASLLLCYTTWNGG